MCSKLMSKRHNIRTDIIFIVIRLHVLNVDVLAHITRVGHARIEVSTGAIVVVVIIVALNRRSDRRGRR